MSDENELDEMLTEDANASPEEWVLPEPVFRTSEGYTPKSVRDDSDGEDTDPNIDVNGPDVDDDGPSDIPDEVATAITEEIPAYQPKKKGGCFRSILFTVGMIVLAVVAIIAAVIYFLYYSAPTDNVTF